MSPIRRFDHVGITVADLDTVTAFFVGLGFEIEGKMDMEGEFVDTVIGIPGSRSQIVLLRPTDGGTGLELSSFIRPNHEPGSPDARRVRACQRVSGSARPGEGVNRGVKNSLTGPSRLQRAQTQASSRCARQTPRSRLPRMLPEDARQVRRIVLTPRCQSRARPCMPGRRRVPATPTLSIPEAV